MTKEEEKSELITQLHLVDRRIQKENLIVHYRSPYCFGTRVAIDIHNTHSDKLEDVKKKIEGVLNKLDNELVDAHRSKLKSQKKEIEKKLAKLLDT